MDNGHLANPNTSGAPPKSPPKNKITSKNKNEKFSTAAFYLLFVSVFSTIQTQDITIKHNDHL